MLSFILVAVIAADPSADDLRQLPMVAEVTTNGVKEPTRRIIHILDWHLVDEKHVDDYAKHVEQVAAVQAEQMKLLKTIGAKAVFVEGLAKEDERIYASQLRVIQKSAKAIAESKQVLKLINDDALTRALQELERQQRIALLRVGAVGQLEIESVVKALPAEDAAAYQAARPKVEGKTIVKDDVANEKREGAIVKNMMSSDGETAVVVLGGDHDLADNLPTECEYLRVRLRAFPEQKADVSR